VGNEQHLQILAQGSAAWNKWRAEHFGEPVNFPNADLSGFDLGATDLSNIDLSRANLRQVNLGGADLGAANLREAELIEAHLSGAYLNAAVLSLANLEGANLRGASLRQADLLGANLRKADLRGADLAEARLNQANLDSAFLYKSDLSRADLSSANLTRADLTHASLVMADLSQAHLAWANLTDADLSQTNLAWAKLYQANLTGARLLKTNFAGADLTGCVVYGISAWDVKLEGTIQLNLVITPEDEPVVTVDNLEVAQFIYLLLHNEKIHEIIDTITNAKKAVLILGRFTPERKAVLNAIQEELRRRTYLPIVFDFEKPASRDLTETISTLAHMARFIIADLTEAKSIPQELERIIPNLPSVPVQPILQASAEEYSMFEHFKRYPWVLETYQYKSLEEFIAALTEKVITPAELKANELVGPMRR
jgi:uncharacterized protein YjbI with pentapeptide repeats